MNRPRKILFPTDLSAVSTAALPYAAQLARAFDAELHVLHVDELHDLADHWPSTPGRTELLEALDKETGELLDRLIAKVDGHPDASEPGGVRLQRARRRGIAAGPEIIYYAQEKDVDLIVLATHGRRGLARWVLGSVAEEVVRYTSRPVLTVPGRGESSLATKCLVPLDLSELSLDALRAGAQIARVTESDLEIYHVVETPMAPVVLEGYPEFPTVPIDELRRAAKAQIDKLLAEVDLEGVTCTVRIDEGRAAHAILQRIGEGDLGLVVQGSHGASGFTRLLLGSVAAKVMARSSCPVLTIKHPDAAAEEPNQPPTSNAAT
jgi:nucleotide-binding universal stress UspA family protein